MFLFNDALITFYLQFYGISHMVNVHSDSERKPTATTMWATIFDKQQGIFYMHYPTDRTAQIMVFDIPIVEHWLEQQIVQWVQHEGLI